MRQKRDELDVQTGRAFWLTIIFGVAALAMLASVLFHALTGGSFVIGMIGVLIAGLMHLRQKVYMTRFLELYEDWIQHQDD